MFRDYVEHGWVLVPLAPGRKAPTRTAWSARENCIAHPLAASRLKAAGLAHAYSGTCALDIDDLPTAQAVFAERGIDLNALIAAPTSVRIDSNTPDHVKLLFTLDEPLVTKVLAMTDEKRHAAQLRCATSTGRTVQDVLPPSIHPESSKPYEWGYADTTLGDWRQLPALPKALLDWWQELQGPAPAAGDNARPSADRDELTELIAPFDPDCNYNEWLRIGMALHHEADGADWGLALWDEFSRQGQKYKGRGDLDTHWRTFGTSTSPVTAGSLRRDQVASPDEFPMLPVLTAPEPDDPWAAAEAARAAKFTPVQARQWADRPPPEWLVRDILPQQDIAMIRGAPGSGKSFWALDVALSIAGSGDWHEHATRNGPVAWIAAEAAGSMRNRLRAYAHGRQADLTALDFWIIGETPNLSDSEEVAALRAAAEQLKPVMIVVDTLSAASGGANENSGEDMNAILAACRSLHDATGALVCLIHHTGKDRSKGARGWSGLAGAVDAEIEIERVPNSSARFARIAKQRDGEDGLEMPFQLMTVPIDMDATSCVIEHLTMAQMAETVPVSRALDIVTSEPHFASLIMEQVAASEALDEAHNNEFGDLLK